MARSHPPTLVTLIQRTLADECAIEAGAHLLIAVSGGADSMALLHVLGRLRDRMSFVLSAHGVDHGLRTAAGAELDLAESLAKRLNVPFSRTRLRVTPGGNLQARARKARYRALRASAARQGARYLVTAHHADDRAETVMIRLLRGTSRAGLSVLRPRDGQLLRPMVRARRAAVREHLERHRIEFAEDPSNLDQRFLRVRVRGELMPLLEQLSPQIVKQLTALADEDGSEPRVFRDSAGHAVRLNRAQLVQLERIVALRQVRARLRLPGDREIRLDPATLEPFIVGST
jgi:tRNA(Ile)-lysidine synthase